MGVHPNGDGTGWDVLEAVDVDQPHGLDYRYVVHLAKAVRKRSDKQHVAFGDTTAGGEHIPGGCSVLDIIDATTDISIDDSTYVGRNLIYDQTNSAFWCFTNTDGTTSTPSAYKIMLGPASICLGGDYTWSAEHQFDASVQFTERAEFSAVDLTGNLYVDSSADFSDVAVTGDMSIAGKLIVGGDFSIDGTAVLSNTVISGDVTVTFDPLAGETGPTVKIFGDWSSRASNTTYTARTDGFVSAYYDGAGDIVLRVSTPSGTTISWAATAGLSDKKVAVSTPVKGGDTWDVSGAATAVLWLPYGDNT